MACDAASGGDGDLAIGGVAVEVGHGEQGVSGETIPCPQ